MQLNESLHVFDENDLKLTDAMFVKELSLCFFSMASCYQLSHLHVIPYRMF